MAPQEQANSNYDAHLANALAAESQARKETGEQKKKAQTRSFGAAAVRAVKGVFVKPGQERTDETVSNDSLDASSRQQRGSGDPVIDKLYNDANEALEEMHSSRLTQAVDARTEQAANVVTNENTTEPIRGGAPLAAIQDANSEGEANLQKVKGSFAATTKRAKKVVAGAASRIQERLAKAKEGVAEANNTDDLARALEQDQQTNPSEPTKNAPSVEKTAKVQAPKAESTPAVSTAANQASPKSGESKSRPVVALTADQAVANVEARLSKNRPTQNTSPENKAATPASGDNEPDTREPDTKEIPIVASNDPAVAQVDPSMGGAGKQNTPENNGATPVLDNKQSPDSSNAAKQSKKNTATQTPSGNRAYPMSKERTGIRPGVATPEIVVQDMNPAGVKSANKKEDDSSKTPERPSERLADAASSLIASMEQAEKSDTIALVMGGVVNDKQIYAEIAQREHDKELQQIHEDAQDKGWLSKVKATVKTSMLNGAFRSYYLKKREIKIAEDVRENGVHGDVTREQFNAIKDAHIERVIKGGNSALLLDENAQEKRQELDEQRDAPIRKIMDSLIRSYAEGKDPSLTLDTIEEVARAQLLNLKSEGSRKDKAALRDLVGRGDMYFSNLAQVAERVKAEAQHKGSLGDVMDRVEYVAAQVHEGAHTDIPQTWVAKQIQKISLDSKGKGALALGAALAAGVSVSITKGGLTRALAITGAGAAVAGAAAGADKYLQLQRERGVTLRELAMNRSDATGDREKELIDSKYLGFDAKGLLDGFEQTAPKGAKGKIEITSPEQAETLMHLSAMTTASLSLSAELKSDFLRYSGDDASRQKLDLNLKSLQAIDALRRWQEQNPDSNIMSQFDERVAAQKDEYLKDKQEKDVEFKKYSRKKSLAAAGKATLYAATIGVSLQEVMSTTGHRSGVLDELRGKGDGETKTVLGGIVDKLGLSKEGASHTAGYMQPEVNSTLQAASIETVAQVDSAPKGVEINLPDNMKFEQRGDDGAYAILDAKGKVIADAIMVDERGLPTAESLKALESKGVNISIDVNIDIDTPDSPAAVQGMDIADVKREFLHNNTASFDGNELRQMDPVKDDAGNIVISSSSMKEGGSFNDTIKASGGFEDKRLAISLDRDSQSQPLLIPFDKDGNAIIPKGELQDLLFDKDGKPQYHLAETVQLGEKDADGRQTIYSMAADKGAGTLDASKIKAEIENSLSGDKGGDVEKETPTKDTKDSSDTAKETVAPIEESATPTPDNTSTSETEPKGKPSEEAVQDNIPVPTSTTEVTTEPKASATPSTPTPSVSTGEPTPTVAEPTPSATPTPSVTPTPTPTGGEGIQDTLPTPTNDSTPSAEATKATTTVTPTIESTPQSVPTAEATVSPTSSDKGPLAGSVPGSGMGMEMDPRFGMKEADTPRENPSDSDTTIPAYTSPDNAGVAPALVPPVAYGSRDRGRYYSNERTGAAETASDSEAVVPQSAEGEQSARYKELLGKKEQLEKTLSDIENPTQDLITKHEDYVAAHDAHLRGEIDVVELRKVRNKTRKKVEREMKANRKGVEKELAKINALLEKEQQRNS